MTTLIAEFTVVGTPVPQGSMRSFERAGRTFTKSSNAGPLEKWRGDVRNAFTSTIVMAWTIRTQPISMRLTFRVARPKSHFLPANSKRPEAVLRSSGVADYVTGAPDIDKAARAVLDALTGLLYEDDSLVVVLGAVKRYANPGEQPGVDVRVSAL